MLVVVITKDRIWAPIHLAFRSVLATMAVSTTFTWDIETYHQLPNI